MIPAARLVALVFAPYLLCQAATAQPEHYVVDAFGEASGYAELETSPSGRVSGRICAYIDVSLAPPQDERSVLGGVKVVGTRDHNKMRLQFSTDEGPKLKAMVPRGVVEFTSDKAGFHSLLPRLITWQSVPDREGVVGLSFSQIPNVVSAAPADRYALETLGTNGEKFDLAKFDKMNVNQALAFMPTLDWEELVAPSYLSVVYMPKDRQKIANYLQKLSPAVHLVNPPISDCGSPFIEDSVRVPSLLEFYFSRQLQISGLVERAYPILLPKSPPFEVISLRAPSLVTDITSSALALDQKDEALASFFGSQLRDFLSAKRPKFPGTWEIEQRNSGAPLAFRAHVTGGAISQCQATGWEQFDIQLLLSTAEKSLAVDIQVVQGFEAPGSLSERPPDPRFKDNPLSDDRLQDIQDSFISFLRNRGITTKEPNNNPQTPIACPL